MAWRDEPGVEAGPAVPHLQPLTCLVWGTHKVPVGHDSERRSGAVSNKEPRSARHSTGLAPPLRLDALVRLVDVRGLREVGLPAFEHALRRPEHRRVAPDRPWWLHLADAHPVLEANVLKACRGRLTARDPPPDKDRPMTATVRARPT